MIGPRLLLRDSWRIVTAIPRFLAALLARDRVEIGLGLFMATSPVAVAGELNRYEVRIASASRDVRPVTLALDIRLVTAAGEALYACFARRLLLPPRSATVVTVEYDWRTRASFTVDDVSRAPHEMWRRALDARDRYAVRATLLDARGATLDARTLHQELAA